MTTFGMRSGLTHTTPELLLLQLLSLTLTVTCPLSLARGLWPRSGAPSLSHVRGPVIGSASSSATGPLRRPPFITQRTVRRPSSIAAT